MQDLNSIINTCHGKLMSLRAGLKQSVGMAGGSSWEAFDLGCYIYFRDGKYEVSNYFPIDVKEGLLINSQSNSFASNLPFLNEKEVNQIAVIVINELAGSYRGPE